jgi:ATP-dependent DNA ligase
LAERTHEGWSFAGKADWGLRFSEHLEESGEAVFKHACAKGLESIVSKCRDLPYRSGRSKWAKVKNPALRRPCGEFKKMVW